MKSMTFIDRPLLIADSLVLNSNATLSTRQNVGKNSSTNLRRAKENKELETSTVVMDQKLDYDLDLKTCSIMVGFTCLAFVNEISAVGRSLFDTVHLLMDEKYVID